MSLRLGRVAAVYRHDNAVDVVMIHDGSRLAGVQVMAWTASTNTGAHDLPEVDVPASGDPWDLTQATGRDMIAVVGYVDRNPLVLGFLFPQVSQMLFKDKNRSVRRYPSDVYVSVDGEGNTEVSHPSGTFLRIAKTADHEDLTGKDVDGNWKIEKNTDAAVHVRLVVANAGAVKADLHADPSGNVSLTHVGNLTTSTGGNADVTVTGTTHVSSGGAATLVAPTVTIDSPSTTCTGHLTVQGGMAVSGGTGASVTGNLTASGGSFTHNGANVGSTHTHSDPQGGTTSGPS